jgi:hypothetical protein
MGLMEDLGAWLDQKKRNVASSVQNPGLLYIRMNEDARKFQQDQRANWGDIKSVVPEVKAAGIKEFNASGQELGGLLGTFAGVGAKTADALKLSKAKEMVAKGADPMKVWQETGWTDQFPDGKWRFEISDDKVATKGKAWETRGFSSVPNKTTSTLPARNYGDAIKHERLTGAYPDITGTNYHASYEHGPVDSFWKDHGNGGAVRTGSAGGSFDPVMNRIEAHGVGYTAPEAKRGVLSTTLHEGQHYVQGEEGFARGGSPDSIKAKSIPTDVLAKMDQLQQEIAKTTGGTPARFDAVRAFDDLLQQYTPHGQYRRLAGEAEARLTQSRMNLTPAERAARPPWLEFDVPREQQIVRGLLGETTGPAMSVEPKGIISDWRWKGKDKVKQEVGINELPSYIADNYGQFMKEQRGRADAGQLGARDLLKAYGITRSSVNRGARDISDDLAQGSVRPEGYMAEWLLSPQGKAYLDAAEKGQVNSEAVADIQKRFAPFGMADTLANDLTYAAQQLPPINGRVNAAVTGPVDQWREFAQGLNGIGPAKSGFIASLLGRGDLPTLDARQLALHTGKPAKEASKYMRRAGGKGGDAAVDRLAERQKAMGVAMDESLNPFSQHLTHHAVWDKVGGTQTTHEDLIRAMKLAGIGGFGLLGAGAYGQDGQ